MLRYGLLGYPLDYSLSPALHNPAFGAIGLKAHYELWPVEPGQLAARVAELRRDGGVLGFNVTVPHKTAIMQLLDEASGGAQAVGAVNTVVRRKGRLIGENTDVPGLMVMLVQQRVEVKGQQAVLLGAGGAARAAAHALFSLGLDKLYIMNRTMERAEELTAELHQAGLEATVLASAAELKAVMPEVRLVMNATSSQEPWSACGLQAEEVWSLGQGWAVDLMYGRMLGGFLPAAREQGWQTLSGEGMLLHQAALAFELWTRQDAPLGLMWSCLNKELHRLP